MWTSHTREKCAYAIANKVPQDARYARLVCTVMGWRSPHRPADRWPDTWENYRQCYGARFRQEMTKNKNRGNSTTPKPYASRGFNTAKGGVLSKESTAEKMVGKEIARRLNVRRKNRRKLRTISSSDSPRMALSIRTRRVVSSRRNLLRRKRRRRRKARPRPPHLTLRLIPPLAPIP